jgi:hypothetical protein
LATAGFKRRGAGERGERGFVAYASSVGPAHEQLRGDDRTNTGFGEQRWPGGVRFNQGDELRVEFCGLGEEELIRAAIKRSVSTVT